MRTSALLVASLLLTSSSVALAQGPSRDEGATAPTPAVTAAQAPVTVVAPTAPVAPTPAAPQGSNGTESRGTGRQSGT